MATKFTHFGIVRGSDNRTADGYCYKTRLRETKNFWVDKYGSKYRKLTGSGMGSFPMYHLDLTTIKPLQNS